VYSFRRRVDLGEGSGGRVGQHYLVVGGTSGIGRSTVTHLVTRSAASVTFCGRRIARGEALAAEMNALRPGSTRFVAADITRQADVDALFAAVEAAFPRLDGAFNAAGIVGADSVLRGTAFHESDEANFDRVFDLNVKAMWRCLKPELRIMAAQGSGAVVNCASVAALRCADSLSAAYTASKHAVLGLTRALAVEYARHHVRINAVCPGVIATEMLAGMEAPLLAELRHKNPGARLGTPEEVAETVAFLLSEAAGYISGATLTIDAGGLTGAL